VSGPSEEGGGVEPEVKVVVEVLLAVVLGLDAKFEFWLGEGCEEDVARHRRKS
jgi:hypothetical protein